MNTYRTPLLVGLFALGLLVLAGCSCGTTGDCAPPPPARVTVARPMAPACPAPVVYNTNYTRPAETAVVTRPAQGVCWIAPADQQVVLPDPPSVTVNRYGQVVSSTPGGRLQPPPAPEYAFAR